MRVTIAVWLVFASAASAQSIEGPAETKTTSRAIRLDIADVTVEDIRSGGGVIKCYGPSAATIWGAADLLTGKPFLLFGADDAGQYVIVVAFAKDGKLVFLEHEIAVSGPKPQPDPQPNPNPPPAPLPRATISLIEESGDRTFALSQIVASPELRGFVGTRHIWREIDDDEVTADGQPSPRLVPILAAIGEAPLPQIVVQDERGVVVAHFSVPASASELVAKLASYAAPAVQEPAKRRAPAPRVYYRRRGILGLFR